MSVRFFLRYKLFWKKKCADSPPAATLQEYQAHLRELVKKAGQVCVPKHGVKWIAAGWWYDRNGKPAEAILTVDGKPVIKIPPGTGDPIVGEWANDEGTVFKFASPLGLAGLKIDCKTGVAHLCFPPVSQNCWVKRRRVVAFCKVLRKKSISGNWYPQDPKLSGLPVAFTFTLQPAGEVVLMDRDKITPKPIVRADPGPNYLKYCFKPQTGSPFSQPLFGIMDVRCDERRAYMCFRDGQSCDSGMKQCDEQVGVGVVLSRVLAYGSSSTTRRFAFQFCRFAWSVWLAVHRHPSKKNRLDCL